MGDSTATLSELLNGTRTTPGIEAARQAAKDRYRRARQVPCPFKNCTILVDTLDNTIISSMGRFGCACDNLPGWRKSHVEQMSKPRAAVKAIGRNGSRVQRSKRRHQNVTSDGIMVSVARVLEDRDA